MKVLNNNKTEIDNTEKFNGYKLSEIIKTADDIYADGNSITNNIIEAIEVCVIGHFGNAVSLDISCSNVCAFHAYNNTSNIGYQIQALMELFDLTKEDGVVLSNLKKIPCRLIFKGDGGWGSECIGFGNFMKDKFVYKDDFAKVVGV